MGEERGSTNHNDFGTSHGRGGGEDGDALGAQVGLGEVKEKAEDGGVLACMEWALLGFQRAHRNGLRPRLLGAGPEEPQSGESMRRPVVALWVGW